MGNPLTENAGAQGQFDPARIMEMIQMIKQMGQGGPKMSAAQPGTALPVKPNFGNVQSGSSSMNAPAPFNAGSIRPMASHGGPQQQAAPRPQAPQSPLQQAIQGEPRQQIPEGPGAEGIGFDPSQLGNSSPLEGAPAPALPADRTYPQANLSSFGQAPQNDIPEQGGGKMQALLRAILGNRG